MEATADTKTAPEKTPEPAKIPAGDPAAYDTLIDRSPQGSLFCRRWWLEAVAPGRHEVLTVERGGHLWAAWPITWEPEEKSGADRAKRRLTIPPLARKLGILFAPTGGTKYAEALSREMKLTAELIDRLPPHAALRQRFHPNFTSALPFIWEGFAADIRYTYRFPDLTNEDALWDGMRQCCRTDIRRARKDGFRVVDEFPLDRFIPLYTDTMGRAGHPAVAAEDILHFDEAARTHGGRRILAALDAAGAPVAAAYVVWDTGTGGAHFLLGASAPEPKGGAFKLTLWEAVRYCRSTARSFDFEGSIIPHLEQVFRGFGAKQTRYFQFRKGPPPPPANLASALRQAASPLRRWMAGLGRPAARPQVDPEH